MADNTLLKIVKYIDANIELEQLRNILEEYFTEIGNVYSYIVYVKHEDNILVNYVIQCNISQTDRYNTISTQKLIADCIAIIKDYNTNNAKRVIGYSQPSVDIILEAYDPLIKKLAKIQDGKWDMYTYEDLCQICRLEVMVLHSKGYYIHKRLLEKVFINRLLMNTRHDRNKPVILSFEDTFYRTSSADSEKLSVADTIPDTDLIDKQRTEEERIAENLIFQEVKGIVIDLIGIRRWDELIRCYGNKTTTATTRKLMQQIKTHFEMMGITRKDFNKRYYE